jgi:hypothetical protein
MKYFFTALNYFIAAKRKCNKPNPTNKILPAQNIIGKKKMKASSFFKIILLLNIKLNYI